MLVGGALFGSHHDHDAFGHDHDHGHDHGGHDGNEPSVSIFSFRVIGSFVMAFGVGGAIAWWSGRGWIGSSLWGLASGFGLGLFMYGILRALYSEQSD